jgi:hypothetical protein
MDLFVLRAPPTPWGDYGNVLTHGLSAHLPRRDGHIQLERVGPFVPSISFPAWDVVVTEATRSALLEAGIVGPTFNSVIKAKVVVLPWEAWDRGSRMPPYVPPSRAPEDYVLEGTHDPATALEIGPLWELGGPTFGTGTRERISKHPRRYRTTVTLSEPVEADFFRVNGVRHLFVSSTARSWLERRYGECVDFEEVVVVWRSDLE